MDYLLFVIICANFLLTQIKLVLFSIFISNRDSEMSIEFGMHTHYNETLWVVKYSLHRGQASKRAHKF